MSFTHFAVQPDDSYSAAAETIYNQNQPFWWDAARIIEDDFTFPLYEKAPEERKLQKSRKKEVITDKKNGYYIFAKPADKNFSDIAADATLRAAALKQFHRKFADSDKRLKIQIKSTDVMRKVRVQKNASLIVFLVDLSWSMAVTQRMAATKKAIKTILTKAYQFRNDICLITFQKEKAEVVIPPTHSISLAERAMKNVSVGGKTPLASGLLLAEEVLKRECRIYGRENISLILLSDCEGNVPLAADTLGDPQEEAINAAKLIGKEGYRAIIINSDQMSFGLGHANKLAKYLNASCYLISGLNADHLVKAVRDELIE